MTSGFLDTYKSVIKSRSSEVRFAISAVGSGYIGASAANNIINYINETFHYSLDDVLNNYNGIKEEVKNKRDTISQLMYELEERDLNKFSSANLKNLFKFLKEMVDDDMRYAYFFKVVLSNQYFIAETDSKDKVKYRRTANVEKMIREFWNDFKYIYKNSGKFSLENSNESSTLEEENK